MLGAIVRFLLRIIYRVELRGREHYDAAGPRTLITTPDPFSIR